MAQRLLWDHSKSTLKSFGQKKFRRKAMSESFCPKPFVCRSLKLPNVLGPFTLSESLKCGTIHKTRYAAALSVVLSYDIA